MPIIILRVTEGGNSPETHHIGRTINGMTISVSACLPLIPVTSRPLPGGRFKRVPRGKLGDDKAPYVPSAISLQQICWGLELIVGIKLG